MQEEFTLLIDGFEKLINTLAQAQADQMLASMLLADDAGGVAAGTEERGDRHFDSRRAEARLEAAKDSVRLQLEMNAKLAMAAARDRISGRAARKRGAGA
jgi:hypothetical protein